MHELSIAEAVLSAVRGEAVQRPGAHVTRVGLRIGEFSGVEPESLRFCLETLVSGTDLDSTSFDFELVPSCRRCRACEFRFTSQDLLAVCPACGGLSAPEGGTELDLAYLEVEQP